MFRSMTDYQDQNVDFNRINLKKSFNHNRKQLKKREPCDNYFGKGNRTVDNYNRDRIQKKTMKNS